MDPSLARTLWVLYLQAEGLNGLLLLLVCGTLYAHRRRAYFLLWTLAWFVFIPWRLFNGFSLAEPWLPQAFSGVRAALPYAATVCGWWHVSLWLLGLLHLRHAYRTKPEAAPVRRLTLPCLAVATGLALLVRALLPLAAQSIVSALMAVVYGFSAVWFAARWRTAGLPVTLMLPVSLGLCALARLYSVILTPELSAGPVSLTALSSSILLDILLQMFTVIAMIVVLLGDENVLLREAGRRLAESEDRFRLLFEHGGVGMALLSPEGDFLQVNPALVQILGYPAEELLGRHLSAILHGEDASSINHRDLVAENAKYEKEKRFLHRQGHVVWAYLKRVPIRGAGATIRYFAAIFIDVTRRKRAERSLREERDFIAQVLQTADALILVLDPHGRILRFNGKCQALSGHSENEVRGRVFWEFLLPEHVVERVRGSFQQLLASTDPDPAQTIENPWCTRDGAERVISWRCSLLRDEHGQTRHVIAIGVDITEQRRLEEQVIRARKMETLGTLVGGIAHDFNNQLTAILGNLDMVRRDLDQRENAEDGEGQEHRPDAAGAEVENGSPAARCLPAFGLEACVCDAERAAQRCARMTARLLTFSRGRVGLMQTVALDALLHEMAGSLQHELHGIHIEIQTPPDIGTVTADAAQLHELLLNLAVNAREAMPEGGTLILTLANRTFRAEDCADNFEARPGSFVELSVRDTGRGMTPEVRERIFEPFFTTKRPGQGMGMGLSVVFGIVKGHKGWITVHSQPGAGTTFRIYLPAAQEQPARPLEPPLPPAETGGRILVVDDEPMVRHLAQCVLERSGFSVFTAEDGEQALEIYRRHPGTIDLVVLDYSMPRMNGVQVLRELQRLDPDVCAIFSSGYHTDHDVEQLLAAGARAFVAKPYRPNDLIQTIRHILAQCARSPA